LLQKKKPSLIFSEGFFYLSGACVAFRKERVGHDLGGLASRGIILRTEVGKVARPAWLAHTSAWIAAHNSPRS
jgi:hypothetical protein